MVKRNSPNIEWPYGAVPFARSETHDQVVERMEKEPREKVLDVLTGTGVLAGKLRKIGVEVSCCDIHPSYFSVPEKKRANYRLEETLSSEIRMGGNT